MTTDIFQTLALECRRLFLRDHVVLVHIGAHDFEKGKPQRLVFNVELFVPFVDTTPKTDKLAEVVDYDFVREVIAARIVRGHVELQETLCDELAAQMLAHPQVRAVRLSTQKPDVYPDCAGVGVEVFRMKGVNA
jgi:dihydroneopterin aldolase